MWLAVVSVAWVNRTPSLHHAVKKSHQAKLQLCWENEVARQERRLIAALHYLDDFLELVAILTLRYAIRLITYSLAIH